MMVGYIMILLLAIFVGLIVVVLFDSVFFAGAFGFVIGVIVTALMIAWSED